MADAEQPKGAGELVSVGPNIWIVKKLFALGKGEESGLTDDLLKKRLLEGYAKQPWVTEEDEESTPNQIKEEKQNVEAIRNGEDIDLPLDTTMTVIRSSDKKQILLHSCVAFDAQLAERIKKLGDVKGIIAPNLQHWVFLKDWANYFPDAMVYHSPAALGESLAKKLDQYVQMERLQNLQTCSELDQDLEHCLLGGAPLMLNETLFFHKPSQTLIASDAFYGGYKPDDPFLTWFSRIWFKITKGSWRCERLPIYRTSRVKSHGDSEQLLNCVKDIVDQWEFHQIIFAHGTNPYTTEPRKKLLQAWLAGVGSSE